MRSEPIWLPAEIIVRINLANTIDTGENHALLFPDRLEGALMRPRNLWAYEEPDALMLAVSYMQGIAMAHAFEQGNKRTGFDAGFLFLNANGWDIHTDADHELMAVVFLELVERDRTTREFETYLADYIIPAPGME
ncbi:type II toxin-antitoxin system death-on-curing family toxin [Rhizobium sp. 2MFCol3.1]|uniref:type II toxin-antitoxin system death-on-curing family toxin n=1 Tax=Rhizobium sp. 2MFCol3.1 TaxID=1246459 RepID=UPI000477F54A|nr:type II toxin-antitoxin system death-on-curing family toxin [Rhizobium sp. 2MFCol3.1]